jgi:single-strand DNA-binding protein
MLGGNLTRDIEIRVTPQGTPVGQFGLAVNHKYTSPGGEKREEVSFFDCEAWGKTAEFVGKFLNKGCNVLIEGRAKQETWEDKQSGQKRSKIKIVVESVHPITWADREAPRNDAPRGNPSPSSNPPPPRSNPKPPENLDEDVPF